MILKENFIEKLKEFGINSYEAKIWTALLSRGVSTAGELSDIANVPRSRSYDVLESLEKKGFVVMKIGKPIKYIAVPPKEILERVKDNVKREADQKIGRMEELKGSKILEELELLHRDGVEKQDPTDFSGHINGKQIVQDHMHTMIRAAEKSVIIVSTANAFNEEFPLLIRALRKAKERGLSVKVALEDFKEFKYTKDLEDVADIKEIEGLEARFLVTDENNVVFLLNEHTASKVQYENAVWINTPFFAKSLSELFKKAWSAQEQLI